jgi:hypothetical protein
MIRIYFWKISLKDIPWAIFQMAWGRIALRRNKNINFWKLLGTGKGETFTPRDADSRRWGLLISINSDSLQQFEDSALMRSWNKKAVASFAATLQTISSHGEWSKQTPFISDPELAKSWDGKVAAITRARIKWRKNFLFWRAVPPVTSSLKSSPGLISAIGIGEAPLGLQGTFSLWESPRAIREFAYRGAAHQAAIEATHRHGWYAEELFARFALTEQSGSL